MTIQIRAGYDIGYECPQPTPMLLMLSIHPSRERDLITPHKIAFDPTIRATEYRDSFGNICTRIVAPPGPLKIRCDFTLLDSGETDSVALHARQMPVEELPDEVMIYL